MQIRRALLSSLSDAAYDTVQSFHSDSAVCFAIFLNHLPDLTQQQSAQHMLKAMEVRALDGMQHAPSSTGSSESITNPAVQRSGLCCLLTHCCFRS